MLETSNPDIDVNALLTRIQSEIDAHLEKHPPADEAQLEDEAIGEEHSPEVNDPYEWPQMNSTLGIADQNAAVGTRVSPMLHFPRALRWAARLVGRIVNYLGTVITVPQRHFNQAILHAVRIILDGIRDMNAGSAEMQQGFVARMRASEKRLDTIESDKALEEKLIKLNRKLEYLKTEVVFQERRLAMLSEAARQRLPDKWDDHQTNALAKEMDHLMDPFYIAFEDQFRGQRADIKSRQEVYLPLIRKNSAGTADRPVIDLGCGRGEWLELLREHDFIARGVDLNKILSQENRQRGLDVFNGDAFEFLQDQSPDSFGAVTAFHLIEHLPHELLVKLMDEALRVLKPGGVAIFETPNPQNLTVGASTFYADPTHKQPLHPETQKFLMEYRGFTNVELMYLHPLEEHQLLPDEEAPRLAAALNSLVGCARDYAVVGYKV